MTVVLRRDTAWARSSGAAQGSRRARLLVGTPHNDELLLYETVFLDTFASPLELYCTASMLPSARVQAKPSAHTAAAAAGNAGAAEGLGMTPTQTRVVAYLMLEDIIGLDVVESLPLGGPCAHGTAPLDSFRFKGRPQPPALASERDAPPEPPAGRPVDGMGNKQTHHRGCSRRWEPEAPAGTLAGCGNSDGAPRYPAGECGGSNGGVRSVSQPSQAHPPDAALARHRIQTGTCSPLGSRRSSAELHVVSDPHGEQAAAGRPSAACVAGGPSEVASRKRDARQVPLTDEGIANITRPPRPTMDDLQGRGQGEKDRTQHQPAVQRQPPEVMSESGRRSPLDSQYLHGAVPWDAYGVSQLATSKLGQPAASRGLCAMSSSPSPAQCPVASRSMPRMTGVQSSDQPSSASAHTFCGTAGQARRAATAPRPPPHILQAHPSMMPTMTGAAAAVSSPWLTPGANSPPRQGLVSSSPSPRLLQARVKQTGPDRSVLTPPGRVHSSKQCTVPHLRADSQRLNAPAGVIQAIPASSSHPQPSHPPIDHSLGSAPPPAHLTLPPAPRGNKERWSSFNTGVAASTQRSLASSIPTDERHPGKHIAMDCCAAKWFSACCPQRRPSVHCLFEPCLACYTFPRASHSVLPIRRPLRASETKPSSVRSLSLSLSLSLLCGCVPLCFSVQLWAFRQPMTPPAMGPSAVSSVSACLTSSNFSPFLPSVHFSRDWPTSPTPPNTRQLYNMSTRAVPGPS